MGDEQSLLSWLGLEETKARQNAVERAGRGLLAFNYKQVGTNVADINFLGRKKE